MLFRLDLCSLIDSYTLLSGFIGESEPHRHILTNAARLLSESVEVESLRLETAEKPPGKRRKLLAKVFLPELKLQHFIII